MLCQEELPLMFQHFAIKSAVAQNGCALCQTCERARKAAPLTFTLTFDIVTVSQSQQGESAASLGATLTFPPTLRCPASVS